MKTQTKVCITSCQDVAYLREGATSALKKSQRDMQVVVRIMFVIVPALLGPHLYSWVLVLPRDDGFSTHGFWSFMHAPVFYVRRFWEVKKRRRRRVFLAFFFRHFYKFIFRLLFKFGYRQRKNILWFKIKVFMKAKFYYMQQKLQAGFKP